MTAKKVFYLLVLSMGLVSICHADRAKDAEEAERARQDAFRFGMETVVNDMNYGSFDRLVNAIDQKDMLDRIYGLRLIDPKIKKQFNDKLGYTWESLIKSDFSVPDDGIKATLLGVKSRGDRGRAVVRYDAEDFEFVYHEYDLRLDSRDRVVIIDWTNFVSGWKFSDSVGTQLVMGAPSDHAKRKLVDLKNMSTRELFQFGELLKAARDRKLDRYLEIRDGMSERMRNQRIVIELSVSVARAGRKKRAMSNALKIMAERYPDEPLYSLMLLDYYFPSRKYEEAFASLQRVSDRLDVEDAAMDARFSAAALVMGNTQDAAAYAERAIGREPSLELGWWSALNARAAMSDFGGSVTALQRLESEFEYKLGPDALKKNKSYAQLLQSEEYRSWRESLQ